MSPAVGMHPQGCGGLEGSRHLGLWQRLSWDALVVLRGYTDAFGGHTAVPGNVPNVTSCQVGVNIWGQRDWLTEGVPECLTGTQAGGARHHTSFQSELVSPGKWGVVRPVLGIVTGPPPSATFIPVPLFTSSSSSSPPLPPPSPHMCD